MLFQKSSANRRGFTLVEMLVVLGIIAVLAALLLPAAMGAVTRARDAAIGFEVNQLASAIQSYKDDKGDYPPNFRDETVFLQHVRRCYPKIAPTELNWFFTRVSDGNIQTYPAGHPKAGQLRFEPSRQLDEGESLVFWLSHTTTDPRYPFGLTHPATATVTFKKYYEFDESRMETLAGSDSPQCTAATPPEPRAVDMPSYHAKHCKDTFYIYIDSRSYAALTVNFGPVSSRPSTQIYAFAEDSSDGVRPYWSDISTGVTPVPADLRDQNKAMNPTTFQLICAGQDADFGLRLTPEPPEVADEDVKLFPSGSFFSNGDKDNIANFSSGKRMEASAGKTK